MRVDRLALYGLLALAPFASRGGQEGATGELLATLEGRWSGTLTYVDYSSEREVEIPLRVRCEMAPGRDYLLQFQEFTDPGRVLRSLEVIVPGPEPDRVRTVAVGKGEINDSKYAITSRTVRSAESWTIVTEGEGWDDGEAAAKRVTQTLAGDVLVVSTTYRPIGAPDAEWKLRNTVRLERARTTPADLAGTWRVDLRPTPEAEAYYKDMVLAVDEGELSGTFYDSPIENACFNDDWGDVRFAFSTGDGSGAYYTTGVLRGDRIEGTTHSIGRSFVSVWTADRKP